MCTYMYTPLQEMFYCKHKLRLSIATSYGSFTTCSIYRAHAAAACRNLIKWICTVLYLRSFPVIPPLFSILLAY